MGVSVEYLFIYLFILNRLYKRNRPVICDINWLTFVLFVCLFVVVVVLLVFIQCHGHAQIPQVYHWPRVVSKQTVYKHGLRSLSRL